MTEGDSGNPQWLYCPFAHPLMTRQMACEKADEVTRRDGPAIACQQAPSHEVCQGLFQVLLDASLSQQGMEHDLTVVPSSLLKKIQIAGIVALRQRLQGDGPLLADAEIVEHAVTNPIQSIHAVVQAAKAKFQIWSSLDLKEIASFIVSYPLQRRRQSKKSR